MEVEMHWLEAAAFALIVGAQLGAVIFVSSKRAGLYARPEEPVEQQEAGKFPSDPARAPTALTDSETSLEQPQRPLRAA
jgi:hypothetical protein